VIKRKEIWKDIPNYEEQYQVSNLGRVKSKERIVLRNNKHKIHLKEKILYQGERSGYKVVFFIKNGIKKSFQIHRLVADAFIPNPENKPQVNHIDGNKVNNKITNLEWVTAKENINHAYKIGLSKIHNNKKVIQFDLKMNFINEYDSLCEAERKTKTHHSNISKCCQGIYKQSNGYIWEYR
jgi:hypothetical protein